MSIRCLLAGEVPLLARSLAYRAAHAGGTVSGVHSWPDLDALPGVADAVGSARSAIASVRRLPANRRGWPRSAAAAGVRAARASSVLAGGSGAVAAIDDGGVTDGSAGEEAGTDRYDVSRVVDPVLAGALRVTAAIGELSAVWTRAPLQALARLHTLAAADLVGAESLGRPRQDPGVADRLSALAQVVVAAPWSAPVTVAVVHGELLALAPFGSADAVVARAAARLTMVTSGLDPQALTVPEVGYLRARAQYPIAADGFATGESDAIAAWIVLVCEALEVGAREATSIAKASSGGLPPELKNSPLPDLSAVADH